MATTGTTTEVPIGSIRVGKRFRRDVGDLTGLAANEIGLLHACLRPPPCPMQ